MPRFDIRSKGVAALICQGAGLGLVFLVQIALARTLGAESYGVLAYVNAWLLALGIVARFGLDTVVLRDAGIHVATKDWSSLRGLVRHASQSATIIGVVLGLCLIVAVVILVPPEQSELRMTFFVGALLLPLQSLSALRASALLALSRVWSGFAPDYLIRPIVLGACVIVMAFASSRIDATGGIASFVIAALFALLVGQVALSKCLPAAEGVRSPDRSHFLKSAWTLLLFNGSSQVLYQIDTIVVGLTIHPHEAGKYYAAKQLALVASLALIALQSTAAPSFAASWASNDKKGLQELLSKVAFRGFGFSLLYVALCAFLGKWILGLFGAEFVEAYPILMILACGQLFAAAGGPVGQIAAMAGLQTVGGCIYLASAILLALVAPFVIAQLGVFGAALTAMLVTCSWVIALNIIVFKKLGVIAAIRPFDTGARA